MSQMPEASQTNRFVVAALYKFVEIEDCAALQAELQQLCNTHGIMGTLLVATEGLNGTISGLPDAIKAVTGWLRAHPDFSDIDIKYAAHENMPFHRMKVRLKSEIVTMGKADILPSEQAGTYVEPKDWNALISDPGAAPTQQPAEASSIGGPDGAGVSRQRLRDVGRGWDTLGKVGGPQPGDQPSRQRRPEREDQRRAHEHHPAPASTRVDHLHLRPAASPPHCVPPHPAPLSKQAHEQPQTSKHDSRSRAKRRFKGRPHNHTPT